MLLQGDDVRDIIPQTLRQEYDFNSQSLQTRGSLLPDVSDLVELLIVKNSMISAGTCATISDQSSFLDKLWYAVNTPFNF